MQPQKPGPRPMPKEQRKSLRMQVPINKPLHDAVRKAAKRRMLTVPAFVRVCIERMLEEVESNA